MRGEQIEVVDNLVEKYEHRDDARHCEWCGSSSNGSGRLHSPSGKHEK